MKTIIFEMKFRKYKDTNTARRKQKREGERKEYTQRSKAHGHLRHPQGERPTEREENTQIQDEKMMDAYAERTCREARKIRYIDIINGDYDKNSETYKNKQTNK